MSRYQFRGKGLVDVLLDIPIVLPPLVVGLSLLILFQTHCQWLRDQGMNPATLVDKMRPYTQRVWQGFSSEEKRSFLAEHRTRWNVARHRVPEVAYRQVTDAMEAGRLEVIGGRVTTLTPCASGLRVVTNRFVRQTFYPSRVLVARKH